MYIYMYIYLFISPSSQTHERSEATCRLLSSEEGKEIPETGVVPVEGLGNLRAGAIINLGVPSRALYLDSRLEMS